MSSVFQAFCKKWSAAVAGIDKEDQRMAYFESHLPQLLQDRATIREILEGMAHGKKWPDLRESGLFENEVRLYLDPGSRFSVRIYFHPPHSHTPIHDHTTWGVSGTPAGKLSVIRYNCEDDLGSGQANLHLQKKRTILPGEVERTLPGNAGIHQTGSDGEDLNVMISVYGRPGRRFYIHQIDAPTGRVIRRYPPRLQRRRLARQAIRQLRD